jgi:hypothetical protein
LGLKKETDMKTLFSVMAVAALLGATACTTTSSDATELADADSAEVCRRVEEMGTNFPKRICMSKAEWDAVDKQTNQDARSLLDRSSSRGSNVRIPK